MTALIDFNRPLPPVSAPGAAVRPRSTVLDTATLQPDLDEAEVWFQDEPDTRAAVCYLAETLAYMRLKQGPAPKRPARTSGRG